MNSKNLSFLIKVVFCTFSWCIGLQAAAGHDMLQEWLVTTLAPLTIDRLCAGYKNDMQCVRSLRVLASVLAQQKALLNYVRENVYYTKQYERAIHEIEAGQPDSSRIRSDGTGGKIFCVADSSTGSSGISLSAAEFSVLAYLEGVTDETAQIALVQTISKCGTISRAFKDVLWWMLTPSFEQKRDQATFAAHGIMGNLKDRLSDFSRFAHLGLLRGYAYPLAYYCQATTNFERDVLIGVGAENAYAQLHREYGALLDWYSAQQPRIDELYHMIINAIHARTKTGEKWAENTKNYFTNQPLPDLPIYTERGAASSSSACADKAFEDLCTELDALKKPLKIVVVATGKKNNKKVHATCKAGSSCVVVQEEPVVVDAPAPEISISPAAASSSTESKTMSADELVECMAKSEPVRAALVTVVGADPGNNRNFVDRVLEWHVGDGFSALEKQGYLATVKDPDLRHLEILKHRLPLNLERDYEYLAVPADWPNDRRCSGNDKLLQFPGAIEEPGQKTLFGVFVITINSDANAISGAYAIYHRYFQKKSRSDLQKEVQTGRFYYEFPPLKPDKEESFTTAIGDQPYRITENKLMVRITDCHDVTYVLFKTT